MRKLFAKVLLIAAMIAAVSIVGFVMDGKVAQAASSNFTIILNPGHGPSSTGIGASVGSIKESVLNEKLTQKVYEKLVSYGYRVYITNKMSLYTGTPAILNNSPINGGTVYSFQKELLPATNTPGLVSGSPFSGTPNLAITIHHNSSTSTSASGYEIYYSSSTSSTKPTFPDGSSTYGKNSTTVSEECDFANMLNSQMSSNFYLNSRGVKDIESSGSVNSLVTYSKVPTVLIEAGFMTNSSDLTKIQNTDNMSTMADRIANAVIAYENKYNAGDSTPPAATSITPATGSTVEGNSIRFSANGVTDSTGVAGVYFGVYNAADGASAFQMFNGTKDSSGNWILNMDRSTFGSRYGTYVADAYGLDTRGNWGYMGSTSVTVAANAAPTITGVTPTKGSEVTGNTFTVTTTGASDITGVAGIYCAVYKESAGSSTFQLMGAANAGSGTWSLKVDTALFGGKSGKYIIDVYGLDTLGNWGYLTTTDVTMHTDESPPTITGITPAKGSSVSGDKFTVTATGVSDTSGVSGIYYAIYREAAGSSTFQLFGATNAGSGTWALDVSTFSFGGKGGKYIIDVYGLDTRGNWGYIQSTNVTVKTDESAPAITGLTPTSGSSITGEKFTVAATGVTDATGVKGIYYAIYREAAGSSTFQLFGANNAGSGTWTLDVSTSSFGGKGGKYIIDVYGLDTRGNWGYIQSTNVTLNADETAPTITGLTPTSGSSVTGEKFTITATGASDTSGVSGIYFAVYNEAQGSSTFQLLGANNAGSGTWTLDVSNTSFGNRYGKYIIDVYGLDAKGNWGYIKSTNVTLNADTQPPTITGLQPSSGSEVVGDAFTVKVLGASDATGVKGIYFGVYNETQGSSAFQLFGANNAGSGVWALDISNSSFGNLYGKYYIDVYGLDTKGNWGYLTSTNVTLKADTTAPTAQAITPTAGTAFSDGKFTVGATGVSDPSGVQGVYFAYYYQADGSGAFTLLGAKNVGGNDWSLDVDISLVGNRSGVYCVDVYGKDNKGNWGLMGSTSVNVTGWVANDTAIMGSAQATVAQMANYYNSYTSAHGWSFPSYYSTATTLDSSLPSSLTSVTSVTNVTQMAQMYYDLAVAEGVRPEVAWAQMLHETGYLQFGGDVKIAQLNFAGLGATGGGVAGLSFSSIEDGIIAQVQHLKAYASTAAVNITIGGLPIDPRFGYVTRGCATTVQALSAKWATGSDYGNDLMAKINAILAS